MSAWRTSIGVQFWFWTCTIDNVAEIMFSFHRVIVGRGGEAMASIFINLLLLLFFFFSLFVLIWCIIFFLMRGDYSSSPQHSWWSYVVLYKWVVGVWSVVANVNNKRNQKAIFELENKQDLGSFKVHAFTALINCLLHNANNLMINYIIVINLVQTILIVSTSSSTWNNPFIR